MGSFAFRCWDGNYQIGHSFLPDPFNVTASITRAAMSILSRLFSNADDKLETRAKELVSLANVSTVTMFGPLFNQYPQLGKARTEDWDFFATVAFVFMAATRLNALSIPDAKNEALMEIVASELSAWNGNGIRAFGDCQDMFDKQYEVLSSLPEYADERFLGSDALGIWVIWNVLQRDPINEVDMPLVRSSGALITHSAFNWWTS